MNIPSQCFCSALWRQAVRQCALLKCCLQVWLQKGNVYGNVNWDIQPANTATKLLTLLTLCGVEWLLKWVTVHLSVEVGVTGAECCCRVLCNMLTGDSAAPCSRLFGAVCSVCRVWRKWNRRGPYLCGWRPLVRSARAHTALLQSPAETHAH